MSDTVENAVSTARHAEAIEANLQLIADLGYADATLALAGPGGVLTVVADARPMTAPTTSRATREGLALPPEREQEAYEALQVGVPVEGTRRRTTGGISYVTKSYPVHAPSGEVFAVVIRDISLQVLEAPGTMERRFMDAVEEVLGILARMPFTTTHGETFATGRRAGDGVLRIDAGGTVGYASPNAVNIMRLAGVEGRVTGMPATRLPGGLVALAPVLLDRAGRAAHTQVEVGARVLDYRAMRLDHGALVLVEDLTEAHARQRELAVKEATIREIHHRVKNNLQTIASLLRIQARRTESEEARRSLAEAVERIASMAVVHDMLAISAGDEVDFTAAAHIVVDMVARGLLGPHSAVIVEVEGEAGTVADRVATSLALVVAELVHNAIEHGMGDGATGAVTVSLRRSPATLIVAVRDEGRGLPPGFDEGATGNLGLAIVRTIVRDDLGGTLTFSSDRGTKVTVCVPLRASGGTAADAAKEE
ncbi:MAG: histidine kinase N-terminal domain-containing protein [Clostridiales bacterium]|nr:histidine kinase N-terminal domain-containing protein [Clostridiales bacterium]